jgi:hypothetical protein
MNARQRRTTDRALYRLMIARTVISWPSWRPGAPRKVGRIVAVYYGGKAADALPFRPQSDHDPHERVALHRLRVHRHLLAPPIRYADHDFEADLAAAPPCPACGGDGMEDDLMLCEHCDGEGYEGWN